MHSQFSVQEEGTYMYIHTLIANKTQRAWERQFQIEGGTGLTFGLRMMQHK